MRYPEFLKDNGTIGFVAPSFGCVGDPYESAFNNALETFEQMGYKTVLGPNCRKAEGIGISSTPENCGKELNEAYLSDESDILISCGGGELMCEDIPYFDLEAIAKAKPKWFMGYSDNTNFGFLSATIANTAAVYGPCAGTFGMRKWHPAVQDAFDLLCGKKREFSNYDGWEMESLKDTDPLAPYNITEKLVIAYGNEKDEAEFKGRMIGGCLDCLTTFLGTRFDSVKEFCEKYSGDGIIWFIESCDLNVMGIRRALWQMKEAGWFSYVKGFLIGRPYHFDEPMMGLDRYEAVMGILREYGVPVVMDIDLGHLPPMMPFVEGAMAEVKAKGNSIKICYDFK
ncbi:MAG: LD-carboxypeptidase [Lachnospiraceae bacterium]|nr:LD-carboxypeptidase [Lachnospiraceae bacterium]